MGVQGLTGWINDHASLATHHEFHRNGDQQIPIVVDGLAFLYGCGLIDSFSGGSYRRLAFVMQAYVECWRSVGLEPHFVWDGSFEYSKLHTIIKRSESRIESSNSYFKQTARGEPDNGTKETANRITPFTIQTVEDVLKTLNVKCYYPQGEADAAVAELAQRLNGFVISNDSDSLIFPAQHRGFVPLSKIEYWPRGTSQLEVNCPHNAFLGPLRSNFTYVRFYSYDGTSLARLMEISPERLPLFATLSGTDHCNFSTMFRTSDMTRRGTKSINKQIKSYIIATIKRFNLEPFNTEHEQRALLEKILDYFFGRSIKPRPDFEIVGPLMEALLSYKLVSYDTPCPSFPFQPQKGDDPLKKQSRKTYLALFESGGIKVSTVNIVRYKMFNPAKIMSDPAVPDPSLTLGGPIRLWIYAVFVESGLLMAGDIIEEYDNKNGTVAVRSVTAVTLQTLNSTRWHNMLQHDPQGLLRIYQHALGIPDSLFASFQRYGQLLPLLSALHYIQMTLPFTKRWQLGELQAAIATGLILSLHPQVIPTKTITFLKQWRSKWKDYTGIIKQENIQRSAELLQTLLHGHLLCEVSNVKLHPFKVYDGPLFHAFMDLSRRERDLVKALNGFLSPDVYKDLKDLTLVFRSIV